MAAEESRFELLAYAETPAANEQAGASPSRKWSAGVFPPAFALFLSSCTRELRCSRGWQDRLFSLPATRLGFLGPSLPCAAFPAGPGLCLYQPSECRREPKRSHLVLEPGMAPSCSERLLTGLQYARSGELKAVSQGQGVAGSSCFWWRGQKGWGSCQWSL